MFIILEIDFSPFLFLHKHTKKQQQSNKETKKGVFLIKKKEEIMLGKDEQERMTMEACTKRASSSCGWAKSPQKQTTNRPHLRRENKKPKMNRTILPKSSEVIVKGSSNRQQHLEMTTSPAAIGVDAAKQLVTSPVALAVFGGSDKISTTAHSSFSQRGNQRRLFFFALVGPKHFPENHKSIVENYVKLFWYKIFQ